MRAFLKAVMLGALAAAAPMMIFTATVACLVLAGDGRYGDALWLAFLPLTISLPVVLACSLLIGLPLTLLLQRTGRESGAAYTVAGAVAGLLVPVLPLAAIGAPSGYWIGLLGAFGGIVTARAWWAGKRGSRPLGRGVTP